MAKAKKGRTSDEKIVRDVIKKYGEVINLRETPFVLIEILHDFGSNLEPSDGGLPGGVPPPPPGPAERINSAVILKEILKLGRKIDALRPRARR